MEWWFVPLLILVLAAGFAAGYLLRVGAARRESRDLAMQVAERTVKIAQQTADLEALYRADEELERSERLDELLQALVDISVQRLGADKSCIICLDERRERLVTRAAHGFSPAFANLFSVAPDEGVTGQVMQTGEPVFIEDAVNDPRRAAETPAMADAAIGEGVRSFMFLPIRLENGVFGVFNASYTHPHAFTDRDQRLFSALAHRASYAIESVQHFERERRRAEQFRLIAEVGRRVTSVLDTDQVLAQMADLICQGFGYYHVGIGLVEGDEVVYRVGAGELWESRGFHFDPPHLKVGQEGLTGWVAATGKALYVADVMRDPRYVWMKGSRTRSEIVVPIIVQQRVIGVIDVQSDRPNILDESERSMLELLANHAATAIENARLYEDARHRLDQFNALQETGRAVAGTLDLDALLTLIIEQAMALLKADGGLVNLVDWQKHEDEVVAAAGMAVDVLGVCNGLEAGLSGWVALHNQPVISNDIIEDSRAARLAREWVIGSQVQCAAVAPLVVKEQVIGTLAMVGTSVGKRCFVHDDLDLLVAFADQAAVAIDNARLYRQAQELAAGRERVRLARELHDAVTQNLFSASLIADILPAAWAADPAEGRELVEQLRQLSRGALAEMRTLLLELRPAALAEAKLPDLLKQLAEAAGGRSGLPVALDVEPTPELPPEVRIALYRIAQEAINNVVKHAQAAHVTLALACAADEAGVGRAEGQDAGMRTSAQPGVRLCIADDGQGFDMGSIPPGHLGLGVMRERAQSIGAAVEVRSRPGSGTQVMVTWPCEAAATLRPAPANGGPG